jgi:hypothetical protein
MKVVVLALLLFVGCSSTTQRRQIDAERQVAAYKAECHQKFLQGQIKTKTEQFLCWREPVRQVYVNAGYPYMDLVDRQMAQIYALTEKWDRNEVTPAEARAQIADFNVQMTTEHHRREAQRQQLQQQRQQANQAAWQNMENMLNYNYQQEMNRQQQMFNNNRQTNCWVYGNHIQCY